MPGSVNTQTDNVVLTETLAKIAEIGSIPHGTSRIGCSLTNGGLGPVAIDAFEIRATIGTREITLTSSGGDFTTPVAPLIRASGDLAALAAAAIGWFLLDVLGLTSLRVYAAAAANVLATGIFTAAQNPTGAEASAGILTGTTIADADTVTADGETYTFKTALSTGPTVPNEILVGASDSDSLDNLIAAMNGAAGEGTTYSTDTVALVNATAAAGAGDTIDLVADIRGVAGDAIATTSSLTAGGWGAVTLENGVDGDTVTIGTQTYVFDEATLVDIPDHVLVGVATTNSLDNLIAAIENAAGEGTTYGTGTTANVDANAAAGAGETIDVTAIPIGHLGNLVATTETGDDLSFAAVTLLSGAGPSVVSISFTD